MAEPVLQAVSITAGYRSQPIIYDISMDVFAGRVTAIIGPNGAGKSTLFKALFGIATVMSGELKVAGQTVRPNASELMKSAVAYVPQSRNVFTSLTVRENLEIGTYVRHGDGFDRVFGLFPELSSVQRKPAGKLSGGQRNMLAVGRALMSNPRVVLLDEVTGGLSPLVSRRLWEHLGSLTKDGVAVAAIEQNVRMALDFSDDVYVLAAGRNLLYGTPAELSARPDFAQMFLEGSDTAPPPTVATNTNGP